MKHTATSVKIGFQKSVPVIREVLILGVFVLFIVYAAEVREATLRAFRFSLSVIVPSIFPFTVLSGIYTSFTPQNKKRRGHRIARALGVPGQTLGICFLSLLAGFPQSGMMIADLYNEGRITREDAERMFPMVNNPSVGFVTVGIGLGSFGSVRIGIFLYLCVLFCALFVGRFGKRKESADTMASIPFSASRSLPEIIREASFTTLAVVGFVVFFTIVSSILDIILISPPLRLLSLLTLEVTGGATGIAMLSGASLPLRLALCAFALGFGGVCVGMQSEIYLRRASLPVLSYYERKLVQGLLSAILVGTLSAFIF